MKDKPTVQELATFLRNAAYADGQKHKIDWSLHIIHPSTNDGSVGYSGGLWKRNDEFEDSYRSLSFGFSETQGIYTVQAWMGSGRAKVLEKGTVRFDDFKEYVLKFFGLERLYECTKS